MAGIESFLAFTSRDTQLEFPDPPAATEETDLSDPEAEDPDDDGIVDWAEMTRPEAILAALRDAGRPMGPAQIASYLEWAGREGDNPHNVGTALARLKKRDLVRNRGYARWGLSTKARREWAEMNQ